jgi:hypothetical protein
MKYEINVQFAFLEKNIYSISGIYVRMSPDCILILRLKIEILGTKNRYD